MKKGKNNRISAFLGIAGTILIISSFTVVFFLMMLMDALGPVFIHNGPGWFGFIPLAVILALVLGGALISIDVNKST